LIHKEKNKVFFWVCDFYKINYLLLKNLLEKKSYLKPFLKTKKFNPPKPVQ